MSDVANLVGLARTALADPAGLDEKVYDRLIRSSDPDDPFVLYAIDRLEEALALLRTEKGGIDESIRLG